MEGLQVLQGLEALPPEVACRIIGGLSYPDAIRFSLASATLRSFLIGCVKRLSVKDIPDIVINGAIPEYFLRSLPGVERVEGPIDVGYGQSIEAFSHRIRGDLELVVKSLASSYSSIVPMFAVRTRLYPDSLTSVSSESERIAWHRGHLTLVLGNLLDERAKKGDSGSGFLQELDNLLASLGSMTRRLTIDVRFSGTSRGVNAFLPSFFESLREDLLQEVITDNKDPVYIPSFISESRGPVALQRVSFQNIESLHQDVPIHIVGMGVDLLSRSGFSTSGVTINRKLHESLIVLEGAVFDLNSIRDIIAKFPNIRQLDVYGGDLSKTRILILGGRPMYVYIDIHENKDKEPNPAVQQLRATYPNIVFREFV